MGDLTIGFSTPKKFNLFSWLIKKALNTAYSHVYISFYSNSYQRKIIYQASGLAVNFIGEIRFRALEDIIGEFVLPVSDELKQEMIQSAIDTVGVPYGTKHIIGLAIYLICKKLGFNIRVPFKNDASVVCSQLAGKVLKEILHLYPDIDLDTATPRDIFVLLSGGNA